MVVGVVQFELHIPSSHSLKEKRQVLRKLKDRAFSKYKVSISEVGCLDKWQLAKMGFSLVGNDSKVIESLMTKILNFIFELGLGEVLQESRDVLYYE